MRLEPIFRLSVQLGSRHPVGHSHLGRRTVWALAGGEAIGANLRAVVLPVGGEFELVDNDGVYRMDVRMVLRTHDDAHIYVQYFGVAEITAEAAQKLGAGESLQFGEQHFFTQPRFETGDARYTWLNRVVGVAEGRMHPRAVEYLVYSCEPSAP